VPLDNTPVFKGDDDGCAMVARFGWRHLFAAWSIAIVVAAIALSVSEIPRLFDSAEAGLTSHRLTNPQHDPAAYHSSANAVDLFYDETDREERHSGQH